MGEHESWIKPWRPRRGTKLSAGNPNEPAIPPEALEQFTLKQRKFVRSRVNLAAPDLRLVTPAQIRALFPRVTGVNVSRLILTYIFQFFVRVKAGQDEPVRGNLRSFWYRRMSRQLEHWGLVDVPSGLSVARAGRAGKAYLKVMENAFETLFKQQFFHYRDLDVYNQREKYFHWGRTNRRHLITTEKEGLNWFMEELTEALSLHTYASRGSASWLDMDYLGLHLLEGLDIPNISVGCLVDYDPWGYFIAEQIKAKLLTPAIGLKRIKLMVLTTLDLFEPDVIEMNKRPLLVGHEKPGDPVYRVVMDWLAQGGGINGEPYGIHIDHANFDLIRTRAKKWLKGTWEAKPMRLELPPGALRKQVEAELGVKLP